MGVQDTLKRQIVAEARRHLGRRAVVLSFAAALFLQAILALGSTESPSVFRFYPIVIPGIMVLAAWLVGADHERGMRAILHVQGLPHRDYLAGIVLAITAFCVAAVSVVGLVSGIVFTFEDLSFVLPSLAAGGSLLLLSGLMGILIGFKTRTATRAALVSVTVVAIWWFIFFTASQLLSVAGRFGVLVSAGVLWSSPLGYFEAVFRRSGFPLVTTLDPTAAVAVFFAIAIGTTIVAIGAARTAVYRQESTAAVWRTLLVIWAAIVLGSAPWLGEFRHDVLTSEVKAGPYTIAMSEFISEGRARGEVEPGPAVLKLTVRGPERSSFMFRPLRVHSQDYISAELRDTAEREVSVASGPDQNRGSISVAMNVHRTANVGEHIRFVVSALVERTPVEIQVRVFSGEPDGNPLAAAIGATLGGFALMGARWRKAT